MRWLCKILCMHAYVDVNFYHSAFLCKTGLCYLKEFVVVLMEYWLIPCRRASNEATHNGRHSTRGAFNFLSGKSVT